ncbi:hypothetical protein [Jiella marina]|uniref:hypothetical protein n=1 Tax=Jiella sp. LLJ827 TaxID=2917712 RepID=UPI00210149CA|nr:hypothetical protein [Jiella sp. LLJ827]MCQ0988136.1 hypothetical protein [Jiella sp. LLJ827]
MAVDGITVSWTHAAFFVTTISALFGAWYDLRGRSLSNSQQVRELKAELEKETAKLNRRVDAAELQAMAIDTKIGTQTDRFHNYRVDAAERFVTYEQFDGLRKEIAEGFRRLEDRLDRRMGERS